MPPRQQPDQTLVPTATTACYHSDSITLANSPLHPQPPSSHLAAVHDLQLRGLMPLWGPGALGGALAARPGLWLRDPAEGEAGSGPARSRQLGNPTRQPRNTDTSGSPKETNPSAPEEVTPCTPGLPHTPRALPGEDRSTGGLAKQDGSGTAPRPGSSSDVTRSSRLGLLDPGIGPGSQRCGEKSGGLSPGLGGRAVGGRNRGDMGQRCMTGSATFAGGGGTGMHAGTHAHRLSPAWGHRHAHRLVSHHGTHTHVQMHMLTLRLPATHVCMPACRPAAPVPATAHTCTEACVPPVPAGAFTCTGRRSPC